MSNKLLWILGGVALLLLIPKQLGRASYQVITDWFIPNFEGFSPSPYWDVSRYSWGYGTKAPGSTGTISKEQALQDLRVYINADYEYLKKLITVPLTGYQWAALLSFSYNLGRGNADNLVNNINSGNFPALSAQWMQYVNAGGVVNNSLVNRRAQELKMWQGQV